MTGIFNIDRIKQNDPLRDKKINALNSIKSYFEGLDKDIQEKHLQGILRNYRQEWHLNNGNDKEFHELMNTSIYTNNFWHGWHHKIVDSNNEEIIKKISINPRKILNISVPVIKENQPANLTLFNPDLPWTLKENEIKSRSKNTPFIGAKFTGKALGIINKGQVVMNDD